MSERGRGRGATRGSGRGGRGNARGGHTFGGPDAKPKKESILDLSKYMDKKIRVKFNGGREGECVIFKFPIIKVDLMEFSSHFSTLALQNEVTGSLKGYDPLLNLVLDDTEEQLRDPEDNHLLNEVRSLGLIVCRGPAVILISPIDGTEEIPNPFVQAED
ncbi:2540_t:CDS:2 [Acaulospora colombiana]|uniref:2540_t:CDS:1 n=1 Tax=Acaulospora colombiana TaxID=27376 RepID=A0ACA9L334_9GLOM|nr:2540_t:CDS:2 [Acaulospora colombiana]